MDHDLKLGGLLDDRFKITDLIKKGGMGSVYEAIDVTSGRVVAIKVPYLRFESDPAFFSRFEREEEVGRRLDHPSVLRVLKVDNKSRPYIVMERLEGELLSDSLSRGGGLKIPVALGITRQIAEAMEYMHGQKVIHRDLKPHNVMRCQDGTLRIMDFGLAKGEALKRITLAGLAGEMGTPDYMSPEQAKGKSGDERSDIYSLGCMLYTMTTGQVPFPGKDAFIVMNSRIVGDPVAPRRINPQISPEVEEITLRAMARDPLERYSTMKELAQDVADPSKVIVTDRARRLVAPDLGQVRWRKFRPLVGAIAVVVAGLIVMLIKSSQVHH